MNKKETDEILEFIHQTKREKKALLWIFTRCTTMLIMAMAMLVQIGGWMVENYKPLKAAIEAFMTAKGYL